jgi:hypothetical protein
MKESMKRQSRMVFSVCLALAGLAVVALAPSASGAWALGSGGYTAPLTATAIAGATAVATMTSPFVGSNGKYTGTLTTTVWKNDTQNSLGGLTFQYTLANNASSIDALERLTLIDWAGSKAQVDNVSKVNNVTVTAVPAFYADRSINLDTIGFDWMRWSGVVMPGFSGSVLIQSDLKFFTQSVASIIDGGVASAETFAPTAVPEPTTLLAGAGALGMLLFGAGVHSKRSGVLRIGK